MTRWIFTALVLVALMLLARVTGVSEPKVRTLEPEDWSESWKAYFEPQRIGQHTAIVPTWREYTPQPGETIVRFVDEEKP